MSLEEQDEYLVKRATELIQADTSISIGGLRVEAQTGVLRLVGDAETESDRSRAELLAKSVAASVAIVNDIRVKGRPTDPSRPAGSSSAHRAPDGWVEGFRERPLTSPTRSEKSEEKEPS